jgi:hypothetical protein
MREFPAWRVLIPYVRPFEDACIDFARRSCFFQGGDGVMDTPLALSGTSAGTSAGHYPLVPFGLVAWRHPINPAGAWIGLLVRIFSLDRIN